MASRTGVAAPRQGAVGGMTDLGPFFLLSGLLGAALLVMCALTWILNRAGVE